MNGKHDSIVIAALILAIILGALVPFLTDGAVGGGTALADEPDPAAVRLEQEPYLYCIAADLGAPANLVAWAKIKWDIRYGAANGIHGDEWGASHSDRAHHFAAWLGVRNATDDGGGALPWCARRLDALKRLELP